MSKSDNNEVLITEEMLSRYQQLQSEALRVEEEMKQLKKIFHEYFDKTLGENEKGEVMVGHFKLQRRIQTKNSYMEEMTVQKLEELNLNDCIKIVKIPDADKIEAAIELGILPASELVDCISQKIMPSIWVREVRRKA